MWPRPGGFFTSANPSATPQLGGVPGFRDLLPLEAEILREAHDKARRDGVVGTDDAMLVERLGQRVRVVPGLAVNVKITTLDDLRRARVKRSARERA